MIWLAEQGFSGKEGYNYWWVAPTFGQAKIVFKRLKLALNTRLYTTNEGDMTITLVNGAVLWFKSADKPDSLYGEDVHAAVIDEASRCKEAAWFAVRSTLTATNGPIRVIGNVKGKKNWAYKLARRAERGAPNMHYAKITAIDAVSAGVLKKEEIDDAKSVLPADVYRELYEADATEDGANPFGIAAIEACSHDVELSEKRPVVWGWDVAKSVDWTVGIAIDEDGAMCRYERWQHVPWPETEDRMVFMTRGVPALVDSTGLGDVVLEHLQEKSPGNFQGYKYNPHSRQELLKGLAIAIQQQAIAFPAISELILELESFEFVYRPTGVIYEAPDGEPDDTVHALALARHHFVHMGYFAAEVAVYSVEDPTSIDPYTAATRFFDMALDERTRLAEAKRREALRELAILNGEDVPDDPDVDEDGYAAPAVGGTLGAQGAHPIPFLDRINALRVGRAG